MFGLFAVLLFFLAGITSANQVPQHWDPGNPGAAAGAQPLWDPDNPRAPGGGGQGEAQWDPGEPQKSDVLKSPWPDVASPEEGYVPTSKAQVTVRWETILRKLDPDDQTLLLESIAAENAAAENATATVAAAAAEAEKATAMAEMKLAEKESEIAALRAHLALSADGAASWAEDSTSRRLTVPGLEWTALSSLYSSTLGASWTANTNWQNGDPCTAGWYGLTCSGGGLSVLKMKLEGINLAGSLPSQLALLSKIDSLDLLKNSITSSLPTQVRSLVVGAISGSPSHPSCCVPAGSHDLIGQGQARREPAHRINSFGVGPLGGTGHAGPAEKLLLRQYSGAGHRDRHQYLHLL